MVFFVLGFFFGWHWESDGSPDYVSVLARSTSGNVNAIISQIHTFCNMQVNVLNDLAEAKRRWTEKTFRLRDEAAPVK